MTAQPTPARGGGRGRRPFAEVRADVLDAAARVLMSESVRDFTVEKVLKGSGVSSATIFKYWPSRGALALDGYLHAVGDTVPVYDTGDVRTDIEKMLVDFVTMATSTPDGTIFAQLVGSAQTDSELADQFDHHYFGPRRRELLAVLKRAEERGQFPSGVDHEFFLDLVWGPCYMRILLPHLSASVTPDFAKKVVAHAFDGLGMTNTSAPVRPPIQS